MGLLYIIFVFSFVILFFINVIWLGLNLYLWAVNGLQSLLQGMEFVEVVYASTFLKWILLADIFWISILLILLFTRKQYKTDPKLHYLQYNPISNPKICVNIHAYNEEEVIEKTVSDFISQKNVENVIVIDNNSTDLTAEIAKNAGAKVITKKSNEGYAHSWFLGLKESLKTDENIIAVTDADGTFNGFDLEKMVPYLDNCDMVIGTRLTQVLTEKGNQNSTFYVWGNRLLAIMLQLKYFSVQHMGVAQLTDVGCSYRCIRREALEKIVDKFTILGTNKLKPFADNNNPGITTTMVSIENNLKIVEVPISFKRRVGYSKSGAGKKSKGILYGLEFFWLIIKR